MWVHSRQFTGRIVTVTNDKVFDWPVYNYTHDFPYIWDDIRLPLHFNQDFARAEQILLDVGGKHALTESGIGEAEVKRLEERFGLKVGRDRSVRLLAHHRELGRAYAAFPGARPRYPIDQGPDDARHPRAASMRRTSP